MRLHRSRSRLTQRQRAAALVLAIVAVGFIVLDATGGGLRSAHGGVRGLLGGLYRGTDSALGPVRHFLAGVPHAGTDDERIRDLERENAQLQTRLARVAVNHRTARQLEAFQVAAAKGRYDVLPARVLATNPAQGFDWTVTIDVGRSNGVRAGQSVTVGGALIGRVLHADSQTSIVLLAVDADSGVGARDLRSGQLGVVKGAGASGYTFTPLDPAARVRPGDQLSTGPGSASSFVPGLSIGTVVSVGRTGSGVTVAHVRPQISATALDLVGVVMLGDSHGSTRRLIRPTTNLAGGPR